jgi:hypothetical protein
MIMPSARNGGIAGAAAVLRRPFARTTEKITPSCKSGAAHHALKALHTSKLARSAIGIETAASLQLED